MPRRIDHDQRRKDVIEATRALIVEGGVEAATMREIARKAGFANGALKHFFTGKDQIIQGTYEQSLETVNKHVIEAVGGKRGLEALRLMCEASMPSDAERVTAGRILLSFWERAVANDELRDTYLDHLVLWRSTLGRFLAEGRADGEIVTETADEQLIDEIILMNVGANIMSLIAPALSTPELQHAHLGALFRRLVTP